MGAGMHPRVWREKRQNPEKEGKRRFWREEVWEQTWAGVIGSS